MSAKREGVRPQLKMKSWYYIRWSLSSFSYFILAQRHRGLFQAASPNGDCLDCDHFKAATHEYFQEGWELSLHWEIGRGLGTIQRAPRPGKPLPHVLIIHTQTEQVPGNGTRNQAGAGDSGSQEQALWEKA